MAAGVQTVANGRGDCGVRLQSEISNDDRSRSARRLFSCIKGPAAVVCHWLASNPRIEINPKLLGRLKSEEQSQIQIALTTMARLWYKLLRESLGNL
jgi:hypothetical protein